MSRYRLAKSICTNVTGQWQKLPAGTTFANSTANAVAGDIVDTGIDAKVFGTASDGAFTYVPLDAAATANYATRGITLTAGRYVGSVGMDSVS
jgi:hypothetical protein